MATLITKVRALTNAASGDFSDEAVQAFLDRHRIEFRYAPLSPQPTRVPGNALAVQYLTWDLDCLGSRMIEGNEGSDADAYSLVDYSYTPVTPTTEDLVNGRWTFAATPSWPVMITCWAYDCYGAAVDLLEEWSAKLRTAPQGLKSLKDNGQEFTWADPVTLTSLAELYRSRMCVESTEIADTDSMPWLEN